MSSRGSYVQRHNRIKKKQDTYIGMTENINSSFRLPHKRSTITLSERLWKLKGASVGHTIEWTILDKTMLPGLKNVTFAFRKNILLLLHRSSLSSKRSEVFGICPSRKNHLLQNSNCCSEETKPIR